MDNHKEILQRIARGAMLSQGLQPDFSSGVLEEVESLHRASKNTNDKIRDMRALPWCSIDNDDSMDLDQLTVAERASNNDVIIRVAIADVDALVKKDSAIDAHAMQNTTSIYTAGDMFPMLPNKLSTDLTSLNFNCESLAIVVEMLISEEGKISKSNIYQALVVNHAKLAYHNIGQWFEGNAELPEIASDYPGLAENLLLQDKIAQKLRKFRYEHGALDLETLKAKAIFENNKMQNLVVEHHNRATQLIEDFMIAANGATVAYLKSQGLTSFRRVVRIPQHWDRIVDIAAQYHFSLASEPNVIALAKFLDKQKIADPVRFPDLSLTIIKLLGKGEYVVESPQDKEIGHFALAVTNYTHSTAPNRRYPDLITQRILKAALDKQPMLYQIEALTRLAQHCTAMENAVNKVERQVSKSAAALLLLNRVGNVFDALCTGAADKGTWVRIFNPPVEGKLIHGFDGITVGKRLQVELVGVDVERGFIDFKKV